MIDLSYEASIDTILEEMSDIAGDGLEDIDSAVEGFLHSDGNRDYCELFDDCGDDI